MKKTFDLICSVRELTSIFNTKTNINGLLNIVVKLVARHMQTEACSIFLLDDTTGELVLRATAGLNTDYIGKIRLAPGEGITGKSMLERRPINIPRGSDDPGFKHVPGMKEERYNSILAVPISYQSHVLGVMVLEDQAFDYYTNHDIKSLQTIASQMATFMENAKTLIQLDKNHGKEKKDRSKLKKKLLKGRSVSEGIAIGTALFLSSNSDEMLLSTGNLDYTESLEAFEGAVECTTNQLEALQAKMDENLSEAGSLIFASHLLMISDDNFSGSIREYINKGEKPSEAIVRVVNEYIRLFINSKNPNVQEKIIDLKDLGHRMLRNLTKDVSDEGDYSGQIIVARDLMPSELVKLAAQHTEGFVLYGSGVTSHISILARSLNIPVVFITDYDFFISDYSGLMIIDAFQSNVIIDPDTELIDNYLSNLRHAKDRKDSTPEILEKSETADGRTVRVQANINILSDTRSAISQKAEGVGLYRSEFLFLIRNDFPSEEEQYLIYRKLLEQMEDVVFRTLDIGGDKYLGSQEESEDNPFMGLRGLRYSLKYPDIFKSQLRALLRAGVGYELKILFPLVTGMEDFIKARKIVREVVEELNTEEIECVQSPRVGAMIELPSAVMMIEDLAEEADFLSIGTNDLVQYVLGVDRNNESVSDLYLPHHPSILRILKRIYDAASGNGCSLSVCGNIAADPDMLAFMIGIGIDSFSINQGMIQFVKRQIAGLNFKEAMEFSRKALGLKTAREVQSLMSRN